VVITQSDVKAVLDYDPESGVFTWLHRPGNTRFNSLYAGRKAGTTKNSKGYVNIRFSGKTYLAHRLVWLFVHGYFPDKLIDHRDRDKANNRLDNLRLATKIENNINRKPSPDRGVRKTPKGRWQAVLGGCGSAHKTYKYFGTFNTKEEAVAAFRAGAKAHFGDFIDLGEAI
jgi:hypothetical protein